MTTLLVGILISECVALLGRASHKPFWFDEMLTFYVSGIHPLTRLWDALYTGADGMTPGYYLIAQAARLLPGDPELTLRLPSIVGYGMALVGVYGIVRKRYPSVAGLAAVLLMTTTPLRDYAIEARCYALLVGCFAVSAALWQRVEERRYAGFFLGVFLTIAVALHYLAVLMLAVFGAAELMWALGVRRIRWRVWFSLAFAVLPCVLTLPILLHTRDLFGAYFWAKPTWASALGTYPFYLGIGPKPAIVVVAVFSILLFGALSRGRVIRDGTAVSGDTGASDAELVLMAGFVFFPMLLILAAALFHGGYTPRYGWPAIVGLVWAGVFGIRAIWRTPSSHVLLAPLLIACAYQYASDAKNLFSAEPIRLDARWPSGAALNNEASALPFLIASPHDFLVATRYAPPDLRARLMTVTDAHAAQSVIGWDSSDRTVSALAKFVPLRVSDLQPFLDRSPKFFVRSGGAADWLTRILVIRKYRLTLMSTEGDSLLMFVEY